jgi:uncharacterized membrane protein HdeD (DUF308 family)
MVVGLARNWWAVALRGLFAVLFGVMALVWPGITLEVLVWLYGAYALADGIFAVIAALSGAGETWLLLLEGVVGIAAGVVTFLWPGITALILLFLIAGWAIVTGIFEIMAALRLRRTIRGEFWLVLSGILSVLFGLFLAIWPGEGALAVVWVIGLYAILFGVTLLALGFRLRSWHRASSTLSV